jgi:hypothetical protein
VNLLTPAWRPGRTALKRSRLLTDNSKGLVQHDPFNPDKTRSLSRRAEFARLAALLTCLTLLLVYLLASRTDLLDSGAFSGLGCPADSAPQVLSLSASELAGLRESVARVQPQRSAKLYEEGTIDASNAWSDNVPSGPPLTATASRPAAYEMRWWAPSGDDIVADAFEFTNSAQAQKFFNAVFSPRCRRAVRQVSTARPAMAGNLFWVNPDGFGQEDVLLIRGQRVYRVSDVRAGEARKPPTPAGMRLAFEIVDNLACRLPTAGCTQAAQSTNASTSIAAARARAVSFSEAVNLSPADLPGVGAVRSDIEASPKEQRTYASCIAFVKPLVDLRSRLLIRGEGYDRESASSDVTVFASARAAGEDPLTSSARSRVCVAQIIRRRIAGPHATTGRVRSVSLRWQQLRLPGTTGGVELRIRFNLIPSPPELPLAVYEDVFDFVRGPARVSLLTTSYVQPVAATTEQQLFYLLFDRAQANTP